MPPKKAAPTQERHSNKAENASDLKTITQQPPVAAQTTASQRPRRGQPANQDPSPTIPADETTTAAQKTNPATAGSTRPSRQTATAPSEHPPQADATTTEVTYNRKRKAAEDTNDDAAELEKQEQQPKKAAKQAAATKPKSPAKLKSPAKGKQPSPTKRKASAPPTTNNTEQPQEEEDDHPTTSGPTSSDDFCVDIGEPEDHENFGTHYIAKGTDEDALHEDSDYPEPDGIDDATDEQQQQQQTQQGKAQPTKPAATTTTATPPNPTMKRVPAAVREAAIINTPFTQARHFILSRLANPRCEAALTIGLRPHLQKALDRIVASLESTVRLAHNNSLLLIGPRGSGKSLVVERAISNIQQQYNTGLRKDDNQVGVVRLTGWAHSDDRTAFKEIARQLCETFSYTFKKTASFGDNIEFLRTMLAALARAHKVTIFIVDEFDAFARKSKQSLLYNLLDALQTSGAQATVIGLTTRYDCMDLLEKRVRSRFAHRIIDIVLPRNADGAAAVDEEGQVAVDAADGSADVLKAMLTLPETYPNATYRQLHNAAVESIMNEEATIAALRIWSQRRPSLRELGVVIQTALASSKAGKNTTTSGGASTSGRHANNNNNNGVLEAGSIAAAFRACSASSHAAITMVSGLSVLELAMLIAAHRAAVRNDKGAINFEMAYHQFNVFTSGEGHADRYTRTAAVKAFDRLISLGMLGPTDGRADLRIGSRQFISVYIQVAEDELKSGLENHPSVNPRLLHWFGREGGLGTTANVML